MVCWLSCTQTECKLCLACAMRGAESARHLDRNLNLLHPTACCAGTPGSVWPSGSELGLPAAPKGWRERLKVVALLSGALLLTVGVGAVWQRNERRRRRSGKRTPSDRVGGFRV